MASNFNFLPGFPLPQVTVDASNGNDGFGRRYGAAFQTIAAGLAAAQEGDTIFVFPGTYAENGLILRDGISFYFAPGASIVTTDDTAPIFDDDAVQVECLIDGFGFFDCPGGVLKVQNNGSVVTLNCEEAKTTFADVAVGCLHVMDCSRVMVKAKRINGVGVSAILVDDGGYVYLECDQLIGSNEGRCLTVAGGNVFITTDNAGGSYAGAVTAGTVHFVCKLGEFTTDGLSISGGTVRVTAAHWYSAAFGFDVTAGTLIANVTTLSADDRAFSLSGGTVHAHGVNWTGTYYGIFLAGGTAHFYSARISADICVGLENGAIVYLHHLWMKGVAGALVANSGTPDAVCKGVCANLATAGVTEIGEAVTVNAAFV